MNLHIISIVILILHWFIIVGLSIRVIMRRPPVGMSLAWLAVIFSVPFVGAAIYLFLGEKRLSRKRRSRITKAKDQVTNWQNLLKAQAPSVTLKHPLMQQIQNVFGFPPQSNNDIKLFSDYESIFDTIISDIDAAQSKVDLSFYIWKEDGRVDDVAEALIRAAQRGVQCRALADAIGSKHFLQNALLKRLRDAGVSFAVALPIGTLLAFESRRDLRNHRKIIVIDEKIAYLGSQNMVDPRFFKQKSGAGKWIDAMVRVTGATASSVDGVFTLDWTVETGSIFNLPSLSTSQTSLRNGAMIQIAPSGPELQPEAIYQLMLSAIYIARYELIITTPYFVPDEAILAALLTAAQRGVQVTLIVPAHNDSLLVRYASVAHYDDLISNGVKIAHFNGGLLHTKSLTIDGEISMFGSVNLDMRSLWLNFEISLLIYDRNFTETLRSLQYSYLTDSTQLELDSWRKRPAWHRLVENTFRLIGPIL